MKKSNNELQEIADEQARRAELLANIDYDSEEYAFMDNIFTPEEKPLMIRALVLANYRLSKIKPTEE